MVFKSFSRYEDSEIINTLNQNMGSSELDTAAKKLALRFRREKHVLIQRAFQLGQIPFKGNVSWLLSHRENGWRSDEIDFLINNASENRLFLAKRLHRSVQSVSKQCFELRLNNGASLYPWSLEEINFLKFNWGKLTLRQLQRKLSRCSVDIKHKTLQLGIADQSSFIPFTGRPCKKPARLAN